MGRRRREEWGGGWSGEEGGVGRSEEQRGGGEGWANNALAEQDPDTSIYNTQRNTCSRKGAIAKNRLRRNRHPFDRPFVPRIITRKRQKHLN